MTQHQYQVGGSLKVKSPTYVYRQADDQLYKALKRREFCSIFNSRQMGKSSLLVRTKHRLQQSGFKCTSVDLSIIGSEKVTALQWYKGKLQVKNRIYAEVFNLEWVESKSMPAFLLCSSTRDLSEVLKESCHETPIPSPQNFHQHNPLNHLKPI